MEAQPSALIGIEEGVLSMSEPIPYNFAKLCFTGSALLLLLGVTYDLTASRLSRRWKMLIAAISFRSSWCFSRGRIGLGQRETSCKEQAAFAVEVYPR